MLFLNTIAPAFSHLTHSHAASIRVLLPSSLYSTHIITHLPETRLNQAERLQPVLYCLEKYRLPTEVLAPLRSLLKARNVLFILVLHWLCSELHGTVSEHSKTAHKQRFRNLMTRMIKSHDTAYRGTLTNAPINIHVLIPATYGYHLYMPREGGLCRCD